MRSDPAPSRDAAQGEELFLLDRSSLLSLIDLVHAAHPDVNISIEPQAILKARVTVQGSAAKPPLIRCERRIVDVARQVYRFRRKRDALFGGGLFADPVWDLLIDLLIGEQEGRRTCVSSACVAAAVPSTTALRWIKELEQQQLIYRVADPEDARRAYLVLAPETAARLKSLFSEYVRGLPEAP